VGELVPGLLPAFVQVVTAAAPPGTGLSSWWRSPRENSRVGGATDSQHLWAAAADLVGDNRAITAAMRRAGLVAVDSGTHVHVQAWPAGAARRIGLVRALQL